MSDVIINESPVAESDDTKQHFSGTVEQSQTKATPARNYVDALNEYSLYHGSEGNGSRKSSQCEREKRKENEGNLWVNEERTQYQYAISSDTDANSSISVPSPAVPGIMSCVPAINGEMVVRFLCLSLFSDTKDDSDTPSLPATALGVSLFSQVYICAARVFRGLAGPAPSLIASVRGIRRGVPFLSFDPADNPSAPYRTLLSISNSATSVPVLAATDRKGSEVAHRMVRK